MDQKRKSPEGVQGSVFQKRAVALDDKYVLLHDENQKLQRQLEEAQESKDEPF